MQTETFVQDRMVFSRKKLILFPIIYQDLISLFISPDILSLFRSQFNKASRWLIKNSDKLMSIATRAEKIRFQSHFELSIVR